ncbi:hypothetical protein [Pistricoccus aurantiacus]|uniref:hypothetical protein n=1 Tax=Pistricoccus aurantiacus TaxID=1883414 RepID=UPI00364299EC
MNASIKKGDMSRRLPIIFGLLLLAGLSWVSIPQELATAAIDDALGGAFSAFAIAKGLNASISVLQSSTLDFQVFQVSVGEALDPANDMIERFSWVMFAASGSLALQKLLLGISASPIIKGLLTGVCLIGVVLIAFASKRWQPPLFKTLMVAVLLRFAVVLVALASGLAEQAFLEEPRTATMAELQSSQEELETLAEKRIAQGNDEDESWWKSLTGRVGSLVGNPVDGMRERFDAITDQVIDLTMIFITQTMLFPLAFLYLLYRLAKRLFDYR